MSYINTIKINFRGGIISPGDLYNIMVAVAKAGIHQVRFGLRQQLLIDAGQHSADIIMQKLQSLGVAFECNKDEHPNIMSAYPAEEVFITGNWLSEGVYKDILDQIDYQPLLKINVSDSNQSFTPLLTGNINWVAAPGSTHFWHLFIRFPKTNNVYEWEYLVYTNDVPRISKHLEWLIFQQPNRFVDNKNAKGDDLFAMLERESYITKTSPGPLSLPAFNLPYYEGLNKYNDKYWLGIYRRDELFGTAFLKDLCLLCLQTRIGQLCSTPWKSLIVKGIEEKDKQHWNDLLAKHQINVRHAANELNFQVEDNSQEAIDLKRYLVRHLGKDDVRTFGICIGIKARKKSEVFSSILVKRKALLTLGSRGLFYLYDILCAKEFNPNERTAYFFARNIPKIILAEQLRRAILEFYEHRKKGLTFRPNLKMQKEIIAKSIIREDIHQCIQCKTIYDPRIGEPDNGIVAGTPFNNLPSSYTCPVCEAGKDQFELTDKANLGFLELNR